MFNLYAFSRFSPLNVYILLGLPVVLNMTAEFLSIFNFMAVSKIIISPVSIINISFTVHVNIFCPIIVFYVSQFVKQDKDC